MLNKQPQSQLPPLDAGFRIKKVKWAEEDTVKRTLVDYDNSTDYSETGDISDSSEGREKILRASENTEEEISDFKLEETQCAHFINGYCRNGNNCQLDHVAEDPKRTSQWLMLINFPEMAISKARRVPSFLH